MVTESKNSHYITIACDLTQKDQQMYSFPNWINERLQDKFSGQVRLISFDVNNPNSELESEIDIYWGNFFTVDLLSRMPKLKWIHCASVGVNRAAIPEVAKKNILVTNSRGMLSAPVSAVVIGMICSLARGFHYAWKLRSQGKLDRYHFEDHFEEMHDLEGETCLIVGLGDSGTRVAKVCSALGMRVTAIKNRSNKLPSYVDRIYSLKDLELAVFDADYIVNLLPLTPLTRNIFDDLIFNAMKCTAFFINVGRGQTVNEQALIQALKAKKIAGAGLDVFAAEPLEKSSELWQLPNTILMPHVACLSVNYWNKQISLLEKNIHLFMANKPLINNIDMYLGY